MRRGYVTTTLFLVLFLAAGSSHAGQVTLTPVQDNTLFESATGALSGGAGTRIFAGRTLQVADYRRRALLQFDIAGNLPAGAAVTGATLTLRVAQTLDSTPRAAGLHRVLASWGEAGSVGAGFGQGKGGPAQTGDATWIHRFFSSPNWAAAGGDFNPTASATSSIDNLSVTWSGPGLAADVQDMLNSISSNHGWLVLVDESTAPTARAIHSREATNAAMRPVLLIEFDEPTPVQATSWGALKGRLW